jgi:hypothetical protein
MAGFSVRLAAVCAERGQSPFLIAEMIDHKACIASDLIE